MMVQTLIPSCSSASKTDEILSRYRPIAPKPEHPALPNNNTDEEAPPNHHHKMIKHSPYLRNIWAHLQARPTRARKRGRGSSSLVTPSLKRHHKFPPPQVQVQPPFLGLCSPPPSSSSPPLSFVSHSHNLMHEKLLTLPLLSPQSSSSSQSPPIDVGFSLSMRAACHQAQALEDKDLILQLKPMSGGGAGASHVIISPKPIRPIGSTIRVGPIRPAHTAHSRPNKKPDEVEADVEAEELPAVVTDSNNRVRVVNSAYKELVGQPECRWLDTLQTATVAGTRISGGVMLHMASGSDLPNGFSCWARIEWGQESVDALCDVVRLCCDTKDYLFTWRFHTRLVSPTS